MAIRRHKISPIQVTENIDYKNIELISKFLTEQGKILSRRVTGLTSKQQIMLSNAIKKARILALL